MLDEQLDKLALRGAEAMREGVRDLCVAIQDAREKLEAAERTAERMRALLCELEGALAALSREAGNAGRRKRFYDPVRARELGS